MGNLLDCAVYADEFPEQGNMIDSPVNDENPECISPEDSGEKGDNEEVPELRLSSNQTETIQMLRETISSQNMPPCERELTSPEAIEVLTNEPDHNDRTDGIINECKTKTPLSDSDIWETQKRFYESFNISCWNGANPWNVPEFVTSNSFIADKYARVIVDFVRDLCRSGNWKANEPVYVVELGSGSGKLGFHIAKRLLELEKFIPKASDNVKYPLCVVLTDSSAQLVEFWKHHPPMQCLMESGVLDVAFLNAEVDADLPTNLSLHYSKKTLQSPTSNPIFSISNYVFDSLTQDAFQVRKGVLYRGYCSVRNRFDVNEGAKSIPSDLEIDWSYSKMEVDLFPRAVHNKRKSSTPSGSNLAPNTRSQCSAGSAWHAETFQQGHETDKNRECSNEVKTVDRAVETVVLKIISELISDYPDLHDAASILVPLGALRAIHKLMVFSGGQLVMLTGDKGYIHPEEFIGLRDPHVARHGSISFMVNYHVVRRFCEIMYGATVVCSPYREGFKNLGLILVPNRLRSSQDKYIADPVSFERGLENTSSHFSRTIASIENCCGSFGTEQFSVLQRCIKEECANPSLRQILNLCRLSRADQDVVFKFRSALVDRIGPLYSSEHVNQDILLELHRITERYYALHSKKDVNFEIGRLYMALASYVEAIECFEQSKRDCGGHYVTDHNIGLCYYYNGDYRKAAQYFELSLQARADYNEAKVWIAKCAAKMKNM